MSAIDAKEGYGPNVILVRDKSNKDVGSIFNTWGYEGIGYEVLQKALIQFVDKIKFEVEITEIESEISPGGRIYFHVKIID